MTYFADPWRDDPASQEVNFSGWEGRWQMDHHHQLQYLNE
jgi:hypothetical protein